MGILSFLKTDSIIPYIIIALMGYGLFHLYGENVKAQLAVEQATNSLNIANETMGNIQSYNEERFEELSKVRKRKWEEGKHESIW